MMGAVKDETELTEEELRSMFDSGRPVELLGQQTSWVLTTDSQAGVLPVTGTTFHLVPPMTHVSPRVSTDPDQEGSRGTPLQPC